MHHRDVSAHAGLGELDISQLVLTTVEARCERRLAALLEYQ
jgi:hypothetical protein